MKKLFQKMSNLLNDRLHSDNYSSNDAFNNFPIDDLPNEVLEKIFVYLPAKDLKQNASFVCKKWHSLIEKNSFWIQKGLK
jgi:hypothetical protein